jgi:hypothetical protein
MIPLQEDQPNVLIHMLLKTKKIYSKIVKDNQQLREKYLESLIDDLKEHDPRAQQTIKEIIHQEQAKHDFKITRKTYRGTQGKGISHIEFPDETNTN